MMKKLVALLMALALLCTSIGAFAADTETPAPGHTCDPNSEGYVKVGEHYACAEDKTADYQAPTCFAAGYQEYKCQAPNCGETFKVTLPQLQHEAAPGTSSTVDPKATCEHTGIRHWADCIHCGQPWDEVIEKADHTWAVQKVDGKDNIVAPVCGKKGYTVFECTVCGETKKDNYTDALAHVWEMNEKAAEDAAKGIVIPAYDPDDASTHSYYIWTEVKAPTCKDGGHLVQFTYCSLCHEKDYVSTESKYWDVIDHQPILDSYVALAKGQTYQDVLDRVAALDADGDNYIDPVGVQIPEAATGNLGWPGRVKIEKTEPDCYNDGELKLTCELCGKTASITIPSDGHSYVYHDEDDKNGAPTCEKNGMIRVTCEHCDFEEQIEIVAPGKHKFDKTQATFSQTTILKGEVKNVAKSEIAECVDYTETIPCTGYDYTVTLKNGEELKVHIACDHKDTKEHSGTGEHKKDQGSYVKKDSTCTEKGYELFYCTECGETGKVDIPTKPHEKLSTISKPSCEGKGLIVWTCKNCDFYDEQVVPATGHDWDVVKTQPVDCTHDGTKVSTCKRCGKVVTEPIPAKHTPPKDPANDIKPDKDNNLYYNAPTCTQAGSMTYQCIVCHDIVKDEPIAKLGHSWEREEDQKNMVFCPENEEYYDSYVPATCTEPAKYIRKCPYCTKPEDKPEEYTVGKPLPHQLAVYDGTTAKTSTLILNTKKLPTCKSEGEAFFNCALCGELETLVLPKLSHNPTTTWNKELRVYETTCEEAAWTSWTTLMPEYLKAEIKARTTSEALANDAYGSILENLASKLYGINKEAIPGIGGCDMHESIKVNKTHYSVDLDVENGAVIITPDENCATLENPRLTVLWCYISDSGESFSHCYSVSQDKDDTFDVGIVEAPYGYKLAGVCIYVTDVKTNKVTVAGPNNYGIYSDTF